MADKKQVNPRRPIPSSGYDRLIKETKYQEKMTL